MELKLKIDKKLREVHFDYADLLNYLNIKDISILYNTLFSIAEMKPQKSELLTSVRELAMGKNELAQIGIPGLEIQYVAIATLWFLGEDKESFDLTEIKKTR